MFGGKLRQTLILIDIIALEMNFIANSKKLILDF